MADDQMSATAGGLLRRRVHAYLKATVLPRDEQLTVLELGCRGENAVFLGHLGHRVIATNECESALDEARAMVAAQDLGDRVTFRTLDLRSQRALTFGGHFDLVLADFGAMNVLEPRELRQLAFAATSWVKEGGRAVFIIMPPVCVWEVVGNLLRGRWRDAGRRSAAASPGTGIDESSPPTRYHDPSVVKGAFAPAFQVRHIEPLGWALPPLAKPSPIAGRPPVLTLLSLAERMGRAVPGLARFSDHYLVDLERTGAITVPRQVAQTTARSPRLATEPMGRTVSREAEG